MYGSGPTLKPELCIWPSSALATGFAEIEISKLMYKIIFLLIGLNSFQGCIKTAPEISGDQEEGNNCTPQFPDKQVSYENYAKNIINRYCTESCHRGGNTPGTGNFTTYKGIKPYTGNTFYYRVIQDNADMPQNNAPLPKNIRDSLNIWIKNCSPQN